MKRGILMLTLIFSLWEREATGKARRHRGASRSVGRREGNVGRNV